VSGYNKEKAGQKQHSSLNSDHEECGEYSNKQFRTQRTKPIPNAQTSRQTDLLFPQFGTLSDYSLRLLYSRGLLYYQGKRYIISWTGDQTTARRVG